MSAKTAKGKISEAKRLEKSAKDALEKSKMLRQQVIDPTKSKLVKPVELAVQKFLEDNIDNPDCLKINPKDFQQKVMKILEDQMSRQVQMPS